MAGLADFVLRGYRIEVKTFAAELRKPNKRCTLLVTVDDAHTINCDFYVLWSVCTDDPKQQYAIGWADRHQVLTAPIGVWSKKTGLLNYGVDRNKLRPLHELDAHIMRLNVIEQLPDGRTMNIAWDTAHILAAVSVDGAPQDYVYRGGRGKDYRWYTVSDPDLSHPTYKDAVAAATRHLSDPPGGNLDVAAT